MQHWYFVILNQVAGRMFDPELVIYNAGTDILEGDPLGRLKVKLGVWYFSLLCIETNEVFSLGYDQAWLMANHKMV